MGGGEVGEVHRQPLLHNIHCVPADFSFACFSFCRTAFLDKKWIR